MGHWYQNYYGATYAAFLAGKLSEEQSRQEVASILDLTGIEPPARIADIGCGHGRHAIELARRGFQVTGIDINEAFIQQGQRAAGDLPIRLLSGDMRTAVSGPYDLVLSLFNSFGFFDDRDNRRVIQAWRGEMVTGALLVMDLWNRDRMIRHFQPLRESTQNGIHLQEHSRFDPRSEWVFKHYRYTLRDGSEETYEARFRLYTVHEICQLLQSERLAVEAVHGDLKGSPYTSDTPRQVVVARAV